MDVHTGAERRGRAWQAGLDLACVAAIWLASVALVSPAGDFPLNDDWSYGLSVKRLLESSEFRPEGWSSMPLVTHVLWGAAFCLPAGFSFDALRASTLVMSLLGVLATFALVRDLTGSRTSAGLAAATLACNPVYYALSVTFMTDVPFTAVSVAAALFLARRLRGAGDGSLVIGSMLIASATLNRQLGIAIPLAFAVAFVLAHGITARSVVRAVTPAALSIGALVAFEFWLAASGRMPALYSAKSDALAQALLAPGVGIQILRHGLVALLYLGLFLAPVLLRVLGPGYLRSQEPWADRVRRAAPAVTVLGVLTFTLWFHTPRIMPLGANILNAAGIGPFTLRDTLLSFAPEPSHLSRGIWLALTAVSLGGATLLICAAWRALRTLTHSALSRRVAGEQAVAVFLFLTAALYMAPLLVQGFYDRYFVPVVPLLAAGFLGIRPDGSGREAQARSAPATVAAAVLLAAFAVFAVAGTRDYLVWNRVRWQALADVMHERGVTPADIDGGLEFNGLHRYDPAYVPGPDRSWWWVERDSFVVAHGPLPGYAVWRQYRYTQWLPMHEGIVMVLEKAARQPSR